MNRVEKIRRKRELAWLKYIQLKSIEFLALDVQTMAIMSRRLNKHMDWVCVWDKLLHQEERRRA